MRNIKDVGEQGEFPTSRAHRSNLDLAVPDFTNSFLPDRSRDILPVRGDKTNS